MRLKTLNKRISTNEDGIFYKEIVNENEKIVDKVFIIRYRDNEKDKLITIGKYSQGIRINYCKQKRNEILNQIHLGEVPTVIKAKRIKKDIVRFDMIAKEYFEYASIHNRDYKNAISRYELHIKPYIGDMDIELINVDNIEQIQKDKIKKLAAKTVNHIIQVVGTIYNFVIDREKFNGNNPVKKIKKLKCDNTRERFLSVNEIKSLLFEVEQDEQLYLFIKLALCTGGRFDTVKSIKKKDISLDDKMINLTDFKNGTSFKGFIPDDLVELLSIRIKEIGFNDEILNYHKTKDLQSKISKKLRPILNRLYNEELELNDRKNRVVIHTLRHTFASHLAINGTPIFTIQKLLNHKDINMTMRYAKLAPDSGKIQVNELYK